MANRVAAKRAIEHREGFRMLPVLFSHHSIYFKQKTTPLYNIDKFTAAIVGICIFLNVSVIHGQADHGRDDERYAPFVKGDIKEAQLQLVQYYGDNSESLDTGLVGLSESRIDKNALEELWRAMLEWAIQTGIFHRSVIHEKTQEESFPQTAGLKAFIRNMKGLWNKTRTKYTASGAAPPPQGSWDEQFLEVSYFCNLLGVEAFG